MIVLRPLLNSIFYRPQVNDGLKRLKETGNYSYKEIESIRRCLGWKDINDLPRIINGSVEMLKQTGKLNLEELKLCIDHFRFIGDSPFWAELTPSVISGFKKIREIKGSNLFHLETYLRYVHYGNDPNDISDWIADCLGHGKPLLDEPDYFLQEVDAPGQLVAS